MPRRRVLTEAQLKTLLALSVDEAGLLHACFQGHEDEVNFVDFEVEYRGVDTLRKTRVVRIGLIVAESSPTAIRRT